ncbi:MAG: FAD-dependent monooxygenase [Pseudomarimonas sp.]
MSAESQAVVVVGSGPAGVSAALALRRRGIPVHLLEAGGTQRPAPPAGAYLDLRRSDHTQWLWQVGNAGESLGNTAAVSPKLRIPGLRYVFDSFASANRIEAADGFEVVGALTAGGLSNAWGCGVAAFSADELGPLRNVKAALATSMRTVAERMGLSGASDDDLAGYLGIDEWCAPALPLDALQQRLWARRRRAPAGLRIGRARVAVLAEARAGRAACDLSGMCLWGCAGGATWTAAFDLEQLRRDPGVRFEAHSRVERIDADPGGGWRLAIAGSAGQRELRAGRVLMAAGTLATTRLVWNALRAKPAQLRLQSNPMAAFLLLLPTALGMQRSRAFGLAQLSYALSVEGHDVFGNLFSTQGLPMTEFLRHLPIQRRSGLPLLRALLPATVVGNLFLPGSLSSHQLSLQSDGGMRIQPGADPRLPALLAAASKRLASGLRRLGGWMLPGSFVAGAAGADLHYAATLPHALQPLPHECNLDGEVVGLPGVHVVDGAVLPMLPAKAHTLTIMANADRIASALRI